MLRCCIVIVSLLVSSSAYGQPTSQPSKTDAVGMLHKGVKGVWFPMPVARRRLKDAKQLPKVRATLKKTEARLSNNIDRVRILELNEKTNQAITKAWKDTAEAQAKAFASKDAWWRSPYLWMTVGFVVGAGATVGIAVAVKKTGTVQ